MRILMLVLALALAGCETTSRIFVPEPVRLKAPSPPASLFEVTEFPSLPDTTKTNIEAARVLVDLKSWGTVNSAKVGGWITWYRCVYQPFVTETKAPDDCSRQSTPISQPSAPNNPTSTPIPQPMKL